MCVWLPGFCYGSRFTNMSYMYILQRFRVQFNRHSVERVHLASLPDREGHSRLKPRGESVGKLLCLHGQRFVCNWFAILLAP